MKTTLRTQSKVVQLIYNSPVVINPTGHNYRNLTKKERAALNDAGSTLAALNLIGAKKAELLPELIAAAKGVLPEFDDHVEAVNAFKRLEDVLKKMA